MKRILIADAGKASLVLTSEVFKDYFPGVQVIVARTSNDAIEAAKANNELDAIVIDFDLPDRNGAQTAAKIKKFSQTPILITAFERDDAKKAIETELAAYDDCLSWLKKPVKAELVVQIAKRFCEGKFRTQRRLSCHLPAIFELNISLKSEVPKKGKTASASISCPTKVLIPAQIEDCSLGGLKLRISKDEVARLTVANPALKALQTLQAGELLSLQLPDWNDIQQGRTPEYHQLAQISQAKKATAAKKTDAKASTEKQVAPSLPGLKGRIAWAQTKEDQNSFLFGILSETPATTKKLFDIIVNKEMLASQNLT